MRESCGAGLAGRAANDTVAGFARLTGPRAQAVAERCTCAVALGAAAPAWGALGEWAWFRATRFDVGDRRIAHPRSPKGVESCGCGRLRVFWRARLHVLIILHRQKTAKWAASPAMGVIVCFNLSGE